MKRISKKSGKEFVVSALEQDYCERFSYPLPSLSPEERLRNQLVFRNRTHLYHDTCAHTGEAILSCIPPERGFKVFDVEVWESDAWDATDFGREYDFSRPFFVQLEELFRQAPIPNLAVIRSMMENSNYTNGISAAKNSYLIFSASYCEDCYFSRNLLNARDIVDCVFVSDSELCYDCEDIRNCYNLKHASHCTNCSDSALLRNCQGCKNCYGCVNLSQKEFHFFNEALGKDEYQRRLSEIDLGSFSVLEREKKRFLDFAETFPVKEFFGNKLENCSGNFIYNNKNSSNCYFVTNAEDAEYSIYLDKAKNSLFHTMFGNDSEIVYNATSCGERAFNLRNCVDCWKAVSDLENCLFTCHGASHCFGCIGIKRQSYCILNRQYTKDEYLSLLGRIKAHMITTGEYGQFFPAEMSPHYYNRSDVWDYYPFDKTEALSAGFRWLDEETVASEGGAVVADNIKNVTDDVLSEVFVCENTGKPYRLAKKELSFYRKQCVPLPKIAPLERIQQKAGIFELCPLRAGLCACCGRGIETVYDTSSKKVFCEQCFCKEVY